MKLNQLATLTGLAALAMTSPAIAQSEDTAFTGPRIELLGGWDRVDHHGENGSGFTYGGNAGYDFGFGAFRVGPEIEIMGSTQKNCYAETGGRRCERADRDLYAGFRVGYAASSRVLLYGRGGYTNARFTDRFTITVAGKPVSTVDRDNRSGFRLGAGVEYALTERFFLTSEYRYSNYSDRFSRNQIVGGVGLRF